MVNSHDSGGAEEQCGSEGVPGPVALSTLDLKYAAVVWLQARKRTVAIQQWGFDLALPEATRQFKRTLYAVEKEIRLHPLWPWLEPLSGLRGAMVAWIIGTIGDPHRFPRPGELGNGTRALWHYLGLYPGGRRVRGLSTSYCTQAKGLLVGPGGVGDSIVRSRPQPYRRIYDEYKERRIARIEAEGGVIIRGKAPELSIETVPNAGSLPSDKGGAEIQLAVEVRDGTPLIYIERVAKTVAVKAFVADMLQEWKRVEPKVV